MVCDAGSDYTVIAVARLREQVAVGDFNTPVLRTSRFRKLGVVSRPSKCLRSSSHALDAQPSKTDRRSFSRSLKVDPGCLGFREPSNLREEPVNLVPKY